MNKIVSVSIDDIIFDPEAVGAMLTKCMKKQRAMRLAGACQLDNSLLVSFEPAAKRPDSEIVVAPFRDLSSDGVSAEIVSRYLSGFSLRTSFRSGDILWGLFERKELE